MILKFFNILYNIENWKEIKQEEEFIIVNFEAELENEPNGFIINTDPEGEVDIKAREHKDWDYKDARYLKQKFAKRIYDYFIKEVIRDTQLIDLDRVYTRILKQTEKKVIKEFKEWENDSNN